MGLLGRDPVDHPSLGRLERRRGRWRGRLELDGGPVDLVVAGDRSGPDPRALAAVLAFDPAVARDQVESELVDHRSPWREDAGSAPVWPEVRSVHLAAEADGTIEWGLAVGWDDDHTLGARYRDGRLLELNGSVPAP